MLYKYNIDAAHFMNLSKTFLNSAPSWHELLPEFRANYMLELQEKLDFGYHSGSIFPDYSNIFNAYALTPLHEVKVVILGQDPYHGVHQAHGLSFSVLPPTLPPPSLRNMFKELYSDLGIPIPKEGNLTPWAQQGVFLLNAVLTVEKAKANAHKNWGWEKFTKKTIELISDHQENVVFILWGSYAQKLKRHINSVKHHIIESPHPSPLSSYRGFFGSKPYSKTNTYLIKNEKKPINWSIE